MICVFRPGMKDDTYYVRLTVDGKKVPENKHCGSATSSKCRFRVRVCEITCQKFKLSVIVVHNQLLIITWITLEIKNCAFLCDSMIILICSFL